MKQLLKSYTNSWHTHTTVQLATHLVLAGTYSVIMIFLLVQNNFSTMLSHWGDKIQMDVFVSDTSTDKDLESLKTFLAKEKTISKTNFVSKESAAKIFQEQMGHKSLKFFTDPSFGNPLPASFELTLDSASSLEAPGRTLDDLAKRLSAFAAVEDVAFGQDWIENYSSVLDLYSRASYFLVFVLFACGLLIVGNAIRSSVYQRREEIEIYELVGATRWAIRMPFVFEGGLTGLVASALALGLAFFIFLLATQSGVEQVWILDLKNQFTFFSPIKVIGFIFGGTAIGAFGAWMTLRQLATGWSAAERIS